MDAQEYRIELARRIMQIDPGYVWTQADALDAQRMHRESVDLDQAAKSFVLARNSRENLKAAIGQK